MITDMEDEFLPDKIKKCFLYLVTLHLQAFNLTEHQKNLN